MNWRVLLVLLTLSTQALANAQGTYQPPFAGNIVPCRLQLAPVASCAASTAFLARTSGLDAAHTTAYTSLICRFVANGVWAKLDLLHIYATQDSTTALLNLVSTNYNGTANGSPTFTADRGFTGIENSATVYIDTNFNAATATSPNFIQDSGHMSAWSLLDVTSGHQMIGISPNNFVGTYLYSKYVDANWHLMINGSRSDEIGAAVDTAIGFYLGNRSDSTHIQGYKNGSLSVASSSSTSATVMNGNVYTLGLNAFGSPLGSADQISAISIGGSMTTTDDTNLCNGIGSFLTEIGVP